MNYNLSPYIIIVKIEAENNLNIIKPRIERSNDNLRLTGGEENDGLEAAVLRGVDVKCLELLHLLLEDPDVIHEGDHAVRRHRRGVKARRREKRRHVEGHRALARIQDEQLAPH